MWARGGKNGQEGLRQIRSMAAGQQGKLEIRNWKLESRPSFATRGYLNRFNGLTLRHPRAFFDTFPHLSSLHEEKQLPIQ